MAAQRPHRRRELFYWRNGATLVVGVDEVGRGPLAGPIVTAAVSLPSDRRPSWVSRLRDSKQLTAKQRGRLAPQIRAESAQHAIGWVHAGELDDLGLSAALRLSFRRTLEQLDRLPDVVLADGRDDLRLPCLTEMIVKGDATVSSIAAASIIAKVARDQWMVRLAERFPGYGFDSHKGYGSARHLEALRTLGPCPEHRYSFAPVAALIQPRLELDAAGS